MALNGTVVTGAQITFPPLESLSFSSNCDLLANFLQSWFDINTNILTVNPRSDQNNATLWVPSSLDENATEAYFRNALPLNLQQVPTFGEILDWEYLLRVDYANTINAFIERNGSLNVPYFDFVINQPAHLCPNATCDIGTEVDQLADLNGPGAHLFIFVQAAILTIYSLIVVIEGAILLHHHRHNKPRQAHSSQHEDQPLLLTSVKEAFSGFSDTIVVYNMVLPIALFITYYTRKGVTAPFKKDLLLAGWFVASSYSSSLWVYRVGACLRRIEKYVPPDSHDGTHHDPRGHHHRKLHVKPTLISALLIFISTVLLLLFMPLILFDPSSIFESYSDSICTFQYSLTEVDLIGVSCGLLGYCVIRIILLSIVGCCIKRKGPKQSNFEHAHASIQEKHRFRLRLERFTRAHPTYRKFADFLAFFDIIVFGATTWTLLILYEGYRNTLLQRLHLDWFLDGWTLGQVLSMAAILPIVIDFIRQLVKNWKSKR